MLSVELQMPGSYELFPPESCAVPFADSMIRRGWHTPYMLPAFEIDVDSATKRVNVTVTTENLLLNVYRLVASGAPFVLNLDFTYRVWRVRPRRQGGTPERPAQHQACHSARRRDLRGAETERVRKSEMARPTRFVACTIVYARRIAACVCCLIRDISLPATAAVAPPERNTPRALRAAGRLRLVRWRVERHRARRAARLGGRIGVRSFRGARVAVENGRAPHCNGQRAAWGPVRGGCLPLMSSRLQFRGM